jgi:RNA polymerase sigma-70 factor, ECF subfamily
MANATYESFFQHERLLFNIAYRMVGTVTDAEDIVQEVLVDWYPKVEKGLQIDSERAYLISMVTRISIDHLRRAYVRRESAVGDWLPHPLAADGVQPQLSRLLLNEEVSAALRLLLERLSPLERVIYVLRAAFDFDYETIASIVDKRIAHCRKLLQRAQQKLHKDEAAYDVTDDQHRMVVETFLRAAKDGDILALLETLVPDCHLILGTGRKSPSAMQQSQRIARIEFTPRKAC